MTWQGIGYLAKIDGRMDADLYLQILEDDLHKTMQFYGLNSSNIIFQ
jgi:hypothetical protein